MPPIKMNSLIEEKEKSDKMFCLLTKQPNCVKIL